jgi:hypothetical protein
MLLPMKPTATIATPSRWGKSFRTNRSPLLQTMQRFTPPSSIAPTVDIAAAQFGHVALVAASGMSTRPGWSHRGQ